MPNYLIKINIIAKGNLVLLLGWICSKNVVNNVLHKDNDVHDLFITNFKSVTRITVQEFHLVRCETRYATRGCIISVNNYKLII